MAVIVITGGTAGVGKATALHFAKAGYDVGIIARDEQSLRSTEEELRRFGINACAVQADVADSKAVTDAANEIEYRLGAIDVWVNNAMGGMLAPFRTMSPEEFRRVTEVTYLGYVNGTRAALELMTPRDRGTIIQVGSALAYRSIPLQSAYCGAKAAIRGFTDAVRTELMHENSRVQIAMVQMPGLNTPQFEWARNKFAWAMRPVPPFFSRKWPPALFLRWRRNWISRLTICIKSTGISPTKQKSAPPALPPACRGKCCSAPSPLRARSWRVCCSRGDDNQRSAVRSVQNQR